MSPPISVRLGLDDKTREELERQARMRNIGLSALLRETAAAAAGAARRNRIREQTKAGAAYIASNPEAQEFFEFRGTPTAELPD